MDIPDDLRTQIRLTSTKQGSGAVGPERVTRIRRAASIDRAAGPLLAPTRIQRSTTGSVGKRIADSLNQSQLVRGATQLAPAAGPVATRIQRSTTGSAGNRVADSLIQRQLVRGATQLAPDINLANSIPQGYPSGFTPPVVNDQVMPVPNGTAVAATTALRAPEIAVEPGPDGHGHLARVTRAPTNSIGAQVHYPTPPNWTDPAAQAVRISAVAIGGEAPDKRRHGSATLLKLDAVDTTRFRARGEIGDEQFRQQILTHEQHHADDHWTAAQTVLAAWNAALTVAQTERRTFPGDSPAAAHDAVLAAAGGTTQQLGARLDAEWSRLDQAFHAAAAGAPSDMSHYYVEADGSEVDAWYEYPY